MFYAQILTLFPDFFQTPLTCSIPARAIAADILSVDLIDIRTFSKDKHHSVDDKPYGGGPGMVMKPEPVVAAIREARARRPDTRVIMLSPSGTLLEQSMVRNYASMTGVTLLCGRYEGIDARVSEYVDEHLSVGSYVLSGGEPAAMSVLDAITRLLPGALGDAQSTIQESFSEKGMLDWPHYTRPESFEGMDVPAVLLSGNHEEIARWRREQAVACSEKIK